MALDASKGNRAKETYDIKVDYGTICSSNDSDEIRKMVAFITCMAEDLNKLSDKQITHKLNCVKERMEELLDMNDKALLNENIKSLEHVKKIVKPRYEIIFYNIADDNSVVITYRDNMRDENCNMLIQLKKESIEEYIDSLLKKLTELQNENKKDSNGIRKKYDLLILVEKEIKKNN